jgi:hypothetical protein
MGYYTRVLSKHISCPPHTLLADRLLADGLTAKLTREEAVTEHWDALLLSSSGDEPIAHIERNEVKTDSLGSDEISEFLDEIRECRPASAIPYLEEFLSSTRTIFCFQHLHGSHNEVGFKALDTVRSAILAFSGGIIQADAEGFTNEDGYQILWQFSDNVSGYWSMAIQRDGAWVKFKMDLGNHAHRAAFLEGRIPDGVSLL